MDIGRFGAFLANSIGSGNIKVKGSDIEQIKKEAGKTTQTGPMADTVEINQSRLMEIQNNPGANADIAEIVNNVSQMTPEEAQAALNPEVAKKLVLAGVLE